jgi:hypothetical protein
MPVNPLPQFAMPLGSLPESRVRGCRRVAYRLVDTSPLRRFAKLMRSALFALPLLLLPAGVQRSSPFRPPRVVELGGDRRPSALAAGDFDRDGRLDLVVGSGGADDLTVLLGDGAGGLRRGVSLPAGREPTEIAVADLNRDRILDLAIANHSTPTVTILLGDGKGGFRAASGSPLAVRSNPHPHTLGACDVDGDGFLDLVIDSWGENRFTLLRGDGKGGFATPGASIEAGRKPYRNLRLTDLDGDGRCDLVAPNLAEKGLMVLLGDGRGRFPGAEKPPLPAGPAPFAVAVGDVSGDRTPDLAVANYSGSIRDRSGDALTFLVNGGRGRFTLGPKIATGHAPGDVAVADVDGDRYSDAVTANAGSGDLTVAFGGPDGLSSSRSVTVPAGGHPWRVLLADFDRDGRADAVTANTEDRSISILRSHPKGKH